MRNGDKFLDWLGAASEGAGELWRIRETYPGNASSGVVDYAFGDRS